MKYPASEKLESIRLVEESALPVQPLPFSRKHLTPVDVYF